MTTPITYKRLVLSGDKAKQTADEVKAKMSKDWKKDFPDGLLDIKSGVEGKTVIDVKTKNSSAASLASKIKDIATRNKVNVVIKDKPTLTSTDKSKITNNIKNGLKNLSSKDLEDKIKKSNLKNDDDDIDYDKPTVAKLFKTVGSTISTVKNTFSEDQDNLMSKIKKSLTHQVTGGKKGEPMSKGQNLPANTKMKKSELKEIIKNFNKETKNSLKESNIINAGDTLTQIEFIDRGDFIAVKFYNQILNKNSTLIIYKKDVDDVINILNSLK